ncbi:glycoside hydrolase family 88 protein [Hwangdonia lutea]|uniref:Glycoside hydrolase family 88 protein n=1 Tax=Hwangdonia lutea TaxID=3075823 RepID=A0AA97EQ91_9FLAO|nr:glycoside hydrolase family 88 protein [Hwangdonia sp. SCSIO 19198]WOD44495.1 glycoside hydrolase family 88 protein [Hwangdonia sp. SCSIO 19198]
MKTLIKITSLLCLIILNQTCKENHSETQRYEDIIQKSADQYSKMHKTIYPEINNKNFIPRTINENGKVRLVGIYNWTSGFYAGSLWYLNFLTEDTKWEKLAMEYTKKLDTIKYWEGNHDVGFIMECSYGNALKKTVSKTFDSVIVQTAKSLATRYHPKAGIIQSWNANKKWNCPVIIDNMMNLELLFHATKISGDSTYYNIAVSHADKTLENHFRPDNSSYHVLNYDVTNGEILNRNTHQGLSDDSAWARGQAWGLYGFTVCYRETKNPNYLNQAIKIADFIINHPNLPKDKIPYWDYNASASNETPRDASAAAITASALYELSTFTKDNSNNYKSFADDILQNLCSPNYFADAGTNANFLLKHSVGSIPHDVEIDVPLNYADYYFLEALYRQKKLK